MGKIHVREARADEIAWINQRYDEIRFLRSDPSRELIVVAELDGARAGIGRLVRVAPGVAELGGIYVLEAFRRRGVADALVGHLVERGRGLGKLYCLPFAHLAGFYQGFGFAPPADPESAPEELRKKLCWCGDTFAERSLLLELRPA
jgi:N-acetylglutamate synthase-like GNAT family acetyltransferase